MNWGKWIVVSFVLFAGFIATLVTVCMREDVDLVSKDYYKEEIAYQEQIERISNTNRLIDKPSVTKIDRATLVVTFKQSVDEGKLQLFCPSNPKMDRQFDIKLSKDNNQQFDLSRLSKGMYRAKLFWMASGQEFFLEEIIYI